MISKSNRKFTTFPTGDYSVFVMEDFLSKTDSSDKIIGAKVAGLLVCPDFVTNGEYVHSAFTKNVPNCSMKYIPSTKK